MIVTTSQRARPDDIFASHRFADAICAEYFERGRRSLKAITTAYAPSSPGIVVLENEIPVFHADGERLFFHPGMALLRVQNIRRGGSDPLIGTLNLRPGLRVLDCTMGMASDALLIAAVIGQKGSVLALESSALIAAISGWGLRKLASESCDLSDLLMEPASRIQVLHVDHLSILQALPDQSFDVVYFDPMFRTPGQNSPGMKLLHQQADPRSLSRDTLVQALRVCRERVVVKETSGSDEFSRLGIQRQSGGRYSPIGYGILLRGELQ